MPRPASQMDAHATDAHPALRVPLFVDCRGTFLSPATAFRWVQEARPRAPMTGRLALVLRPFSDSNVIPSARGGRWRPAGAAGKCSGARSASDEFVGDAQACGGTLGRSEWETNAVERCISVSRCAVAWIDRDHRCFVGSAWVTSSKATLTAADASCISWTRASCVARLWYACRRTAGREEWAPEGRSWHRGRARAGGGRGRGGGRSRSPWRVPPPSARGT